MSHRPARRIAAVSSVVAALAGLLPIAGPGRHAWADAHPGTPAPGTAGGVTKFVVFGPQSYVRAHGRPTPIRREFTVTDPDAPYWIRIANDGVSSAVIRLNGEVVVGPSAFNRNVESIEERVTLLLRNSLTVELRGAPGSGFALEIVGHDSGPPTIQVINPANGALLDHANPVLEIVYSDTTSGIDTGSFTLVVGGVDVTSAASVSPTGASHTPPSPLPEGANRATATISDHAGNSRSATVDFTVDTGPPQVRFDRPADGIPVNSATPTFDIVFSDGVSGIDQASFLLEVNGVDVTPGSSVTPSGAGYTPAEALPEGAASAWVTVSDRAGNSRSTTVDLTVDTVPPEIRFDAPSSGSTVRSGTPAFHVAFSDATSGIAGGTFRLELDGADVTSSAIQHGDHATFEPAASLSDGPHAATATIADRAGNARTTATAFTVAHAAACNARGTGTTFDRETAREMAQLSNVAYTLDDPEDACWVEESVIRSEADFTCAYALTETAQLVVFKDSQNGDLAVAFKGSTCEDLANCSDFVADGAVARTDWTLADGTVVPNSVHTGFYCYYQSVRSELREQLLEQVAMVADRSTARVYFTGHSLGGAQAALASLDLASMLVEQGYASDNIVLYTFGAPRAFTSDLQEHFVVEVPNHFAVADKEDLVPHVPAAQPYVNLRRMVILNALWPEDSDVEKVRLEFGAGESYQGCATVPPVPGPDGTRRHNREEYVTRLLPEIITDERPGMSLSVNALGNMVMEWQGDVEGACDRVALYRGDPFGGGELTAIPEWVRTNDNGTHATLVPKSPLHHIAYINGFDRIVDVVPFEPEVPASLTIEGWGANNGLLRVNWGARLGDVGTHDFVAVYEHRPTRDTVHEWVLQNNVFNEPDHHWSTTLSMSRRDYWAAYVTSETGNALELRSHPERARILKVVRHDLPAVWLVKKAEPWPLKDDLVVRWSVPADGELVNDFVAIYEHRPSDGSPHDHARKHNASLDADNKWDTNLNWEIGGLWAAYVRQPGLDAASAFVLAEVRHSPGAPQSAPSSMMPPIAGRQKAARPSSATSPVDPDPPDARSAVTASGTARAAFALRAQYPVAARLTVAFRLDGEVPATLAVYDVSGRRVTLRPVVPAGQGWRTMQFDGLPPGVYGVRLKQGDRSLSCRAAVVH